MREVEVRDVARFKKNFEQSMEPVIDALVARILRMDQEARLYRTDAEFWLGFQIGEKPTGGRGRPFVQLVTEHKGKDANRAARLFFTTPVRGEKYADPLGLLESSGTWGGQPHVTLHPGSDLEPLMVLVEQSYHFKIEKLKSVTTQFRRRR